jgi:GNAT superfamily N-acetyltransferase
MCAAGKVCFQLYDQGYPEEGTTRGALQTHGKVCRRLGVNSLSLAVYSAVGRGSPTTTYTLLAGVAALVVGAAAWLRRRTIRRGGGEKMAARMRRLKAMLEQLDTVLETAADDATPAPPDEASQADADAADDPDRVVVTIGTSAEAQRDPTLARHITTMVNTSYTQSLAAQLPPGGVYERTSVGDVMNRLQMGDDGARANRVLHLAWRRGECVGVCSSTYQPPWCQEGCGHWGLVVAHVDHQGTGVASALVRAAEARLAGACEMIQIEYEYTPGDDYSERLYAWYEQRCGFTCARGPPHARPGGGAQFRKCHKPVPEAAQRAAKRRRLLAMRGQVVTELAELEAEIGAAVGCEEAAAAGGADGGAAGAAAGGVVPEAVKAAVRAAMLGKAVEVCGLGSLP